ncbi:hypothetical protein M0802_015508 [Mischocyttarus mexicanus]|nr:hypothetical protein M0802_015508 [Mischocyttarus mexicanus]
MVNVKCRSGRQIKPQIIVDYNTQKSAVDLSDQMNAYNNPLRKSQKWCDLGQSGYQPYWPQKFIGTTRKRNNKNNGDVSDLANPIKDDGQSEATVEEVQHICQVTECGRKFKTKRGLGVHQQKAHKDWEAGLADVPGLGEVNGNGNVTGIRARSRALASRGSSLLRGFLSVRPVEVVLFGRHSTLSSELARTRGIRLSN